MNSRLLLVIYVIVIISIPVGAYLASQQTSIKSKASEPQSTKKVVTSPKPTLPPTTSATKKLVENAKLGVEQPTSSPTPESQVATTFGPTLSLKVNFEGRGKDNQSGRLFIGLVEGAISLNPKFLLSFTVDIPKTGEFTNLSLAGLDPGTTYSALLKGSGQIAKAVEFIMSPTATNLARGEAVFLTSGDLNEDNTINTSDYSIAQKSSGATSTSSNWNENADFNKDNVINSFDLAIITKNFGKIGDSGAWTSPLPKTATPSGTLNPQGLPDGSQGYWLWVPGF